MPSGSSSRSPKVEKLDRIFTPLLAGARWRDRLVAAAGGLIGIAFTALISHAIAATPQEALLLAAPIGASAVLVFALPSSPLSQPIPVVLGTMISTACGVLAVQLFGQTSWAAGLAVGLAILLMSVGRCLHAPGGGCALVPVIGGPAVMAKGYALAVIPFGLNALVLVIAGLLFHRFSGHSYPHRAAAPVSPERARVLTQDIEKALDEVGEAFDVSVEDLEALLERAERHAAARAVR
jgi:CBS domain-containing membrane protein